MPMPINFLLYNYTFFPLFSSLCDLEDSAAATQEKISASSMDEDDMETTFVPSMVYLPVAKKINQPLTVAFSLTPA